MTLNRPYLHVYLFSKGTYYTDTYLQIYLHQNKFLPSGVVESGVHVYVGVEIDRAAFLSILKVCILRMYISSIIQVYTSRTHEYLRINAYVHTYILVS